MKATIQFIGLLGLSLMWSCQTTQGIVDTTPKSEVDFVKSDQFFSVLDKAEEEGKLVFVDFYASYCIPCKMMDEDVFTDRETAMVINRDFISFKVDGNGALGQKLTGLYGVYAYPTLLFMDAKGVVLERKDGAAYQTQLQQMARRALNKESVYARVN